MDKLGKITVMVNGFGDMAKNVMRHILPDERFELMPYALFGPSPQKHVVPFEEMEIVLFEPHQKEEILSLKDDYGDFITVDFTHPTAVNENAEFYCKNRLPFVMGTTGGDREHLTQTVLGSKIVAVIAPNMAKQIVGFQAMMEYAADTFPDLFKGYLLKIRESHQKSKADTSGTAKAMVGYFNKLGIPFPENEIIKERDLSIQKNMGVPEKYLSGHGWHTYTLISKDRTVEFAFTHNVNGRDIYAQGTIDAILFLDKKIEEGVKGKIFTMIDVLKG